MPHQIRLAGPWEFSTDGGANWERCQLPFEFPETAADSKLKRRFHRPTGLEIESSVILKLTGTNLPKTMQLNDNEVSLSPAPESAVTPTLTRLLQPFNEICVARSDSEAIVVESVVLQIDD